MGLVDPVTPCAECGDREEPLNDDRLCASCAERVAAEGR
jgi:hypothetical protein